MQYAEASIATLWVLVTLALAVAGAALALGVHLAREHKALGAERGDALATANHALGMVETTREVMTRMAVAAVSTPEGSAAVAAAAVKEAVPPAAVVTAPVPQQSPAPILMPEAASALPVEPAWSSHFTDMHRRLEALLAAQEHLLVVQQASAASVAAAPTAGGVAAGPAAFISLPIASSPMTSPVPVA